MNLVPAPARRALLNRGLQLESLTVGWNLLEGAIAVSAARVVVVILVRDGSEAWSGEEHDG